LAEHVGVDITAVPAILLMSVEEADAAKFKFTGEIN